MYKVIIVEDEMFVRLGMKSMIPWEKYEMEVVADFPNGFQALEYFTKEKPHLVITDIKMPVMDGLTLIREIRKISEETQIILLTCVEEFEMAKEAIRLGTLGYISKLSMKEDEFEKLIEKAQQILEQQQNKERFVVCENDRKVVKREILRRIIYNSYYDNKQIHNYIQNLNLALNGNNLVLCRLHVDGMENLSNDRHKRQDAIMNLLEETVHRMCVGEVTSLTEDEYVLFFNLSGLENEKKCTERIEELAQNITSTVSRYFNLSCFIGIATLCGEPQTLPIKMREATQALNARFMMEPQIRYSWFGMRGEMESVRELLLGLLKENHGALNEEEKRGFVLRINEVEACNEEIRNIILTVLYELFQMVIRGSNMSLVQKQELPLKLYRRLERCHTVYDAAACYEEAVGEMERGSGYQKGIRREIVAARDIIDKNYSKNLSLTDIAESVNLSPAYFSTLFKKELGNNFAEYLYGIRIDKAKELLLHTDEAVYEISEKVGFKDQTYFSRIFKSKVGESPGEYRKKRTIKEVRDES